MAQNKTKNLLGAAAIAFAAACTVAPIVGGINSNSFETGFMNTITAGQWSRLTR